MIKKLTISLLCFGHLSVFGYSVKVKNLSDGIIEATVKYTSGEEKFSIKPRQKKTLKAGGLQVLLCIKSLVIRPITGPAVKKEYTAIKEKKDEKEGIGEPIRTGFGISCRNSSFKVHQLADNTLSVETAGIPSGYYTATVHNKTDGQAAIKIKTTAKGVGVCPDIRAHVNAGDSKQINLALCCVSSVIIRPTSGSSLKKKFKFIPPRTGVQERCGSFDLYITQLPDGTLLTTPRP